MSSLAHEYQITIFSPQGKLIQVEYAFQAVKTAGLTAIAVKGKDTAVIAIEKKVTDRLIDPKSVTSIYSITEGIGAVTIGLVPDAKAVISRMRMEAADYKFENGHQCPIDILCSRWADLAQMYTQHAFMRPLGVETICVSIDDERGPQIFKVDPAGQFTGYKACSSGVKEAETTSQLEKTFKDKGEQTKNMNRNETIQLALGTLQNVLSSNFKGTDVEIGVVSKGEKFRKLTEKEIDEHLNVLATKD